MKRAIRFIKNVIKESSSFLYVGFTRADVGTFARFCIAQTARMFNALKGVSHINDKRIAKSQFLAKGLHQLLPFDSRFTYSILLPVKKPNLLFFRKGLQSLLEQTSPQFEVLVGFEAPPSSKMTTLLERCKAAFPGKIREFYLHDDRDFTFNQLANEAKNHFLLIVDQEDWLRPDLLYRYEQTLRLLPHPEKTVLYCYENQFDENHYFVQLSTQQKPDSLTFPYFFETFSHKGLLIPTTLWKQLGGLIKRYEGAEFEDLLLRLGQFNTTFQCVPLPLYSVRKAAQKPKKSLAAFLKAAREHIPEWDWEPGYTPHSVRGMPPLDKKHSVQVIIPFKDQKELTLKCIDSLLKQVDVEFKITAIDNNSKDLSIAEAIEELGGEVIKINEPFNYSRLNNLAVKSTKTASECDVLLFLNNDIELHFNAIAEMLRWVDQPGIGMIGCRLHYPDGRLQHGGVTADKIFADVGWEHIEKFKTFDRMVQTKKLGFFPAVTAACAMIKRELFTSVGGFDEIWYPIGYSDTNLAVKVQMKGLRCFYTPYASGVHYESVSRQASLEDYESSVWLHDLWMQQHKK